MPVLFSLFVLFFTQICQMLSEDIIIWAIHMPLLISSIKQSLYAEHVLMLMFVSVFRTSLLDQYRSKLLKGKLCLYRQSVCFVCVSMNKKQGVWPLVLSGWLKAAMLKLSFSLLLSDSFDESFEEPFSLPAPPLSTYKWVEPYWLSQLYGARSFHTNNANA